MIDNLQRDNDAMKVFVVECEKSKAGLPSQSWIKNNEDTMEVVRKVWLKGLGSTVVETSGLEIPF